MIAGRFGKQLDLQYRQWLVPQINAWRSRLIRNTLEKRPQDKNRFLQSIQIPLTYGNITCGFECMGSYSDTLPEVVRIGDTPFEYFGSVDGSSPFRFNDTGTDPWISQGMTAHLYHTYRLDTEHGRVILPNQRITKVMATGIFDQPNEALAWQCSNGDGGCDWWNAEYPISGDILEMVKKALWDELDEPGKPQEIQPAKANQDE